MRILVAALATFTLVATAQADEYTVSTWPQGIKELPCSAFRRNGLNDWTLIATVHAGGLTLSRINFKHTREGKMIEAKCGSK